MLHGSLACHLEYTSSRTSLSVGWLSFSPPEKERYSRFWDFYCSMTLQCCKSHPALRLVRELVFSRWQASEHPLKKGSLEDVIAWREGHLGVHCLKRGSLEDSIAWRKHCLKRGLLEERVTWRWHCLKRVSLEDEFAWTECPLTRGLLEESSLE